MEGQRLPPGRGSLAQTWRALVVMYKNWQMPSASYLFRLDGMDMGQCTMVYRGDFNRRMVWMAFMISGVAIIPSSIILTYITYLSCTGGYEPDDEYDELQSVKPFMFVFATMCVFMTKLGLICSRYVIRTYYSLSKKEFTVVTHDIFRPLRVKKYICKSGEAAPVQTGNFRAFFLGNVTTSHGRFAMHKEHFKLPIYYNVFFGYQKDKDIEKLGDTNANVDEQFKLRRREFKSEKFEREE